MTAPKLTPACKLCPVCGHPPRWHPSQIRPAESIGCNLEPHCPEKGSFDFSTPYLPDDEAIAMWNEAVDRFLKDGFAGLAALVDKE